MKPKIFRMYEPGFDRFVWCYYEKGRSVYALTFIELISWFNKQGQS